MAFCSLKWRIVRNIEIITCTAFAMTDNNTSVVNYRVDLAHYPQLGTAKYAISANF